MTCRIAMLVCLGVLAMGIARAEADPIIYSQASNFPDGEAFASQNDTAGNGNFATVYDNFTLAGDALITDVHWTGGYFNPETAGTITAFTITFWADALGQIESSLLTQTVAGNANETVLGLDNEGTPTYNYSLVLPTSLLADGGTQYWLSIVPDAAFPPQWGWYTSDIGDDLAYQDFFGTRDPLQTDFAFDLTGQVVPEPISLMLLGTGVAGWIRWRANRRRSDQKPRACNDKSRPLRND